MKEVPLTELYKREVDYWREGSGWNWNLIDNYLPPQVRTQIAPIFLRQDEEDSNGLCWDSTTNGEFITKSAYELVEGETNTVAEWSWMTPWKIQVPQRIRLFIWIILYGQDMTNVERTRRGMATYPYCSYCQGSPEDLDHVLRTCPQARKIWMRFGSEVDKRSLQHLPFHD